MDLGAFSISLPVSDLDVSRGFYENLGFDVVGGDPDQNYLILANGTTLVGLFQGMFDKPMLTFNPGLNNKTEEIEPFTDVREIQRALEDAGVSLEEGVADDNPEGPGHVMLIDPDGNPILIDQFR